MPTRPRYSIPDFMREALRELKGGNFYMNMKWSEKKGFV